MSSTNYDDYVQLISSPHRNERDGAKAALLGGGKPAIAALIRGMSHSNPKMRVWCTKLLDHMEADWDEHCVQAVLERLEDPVPRVRSHALHVLSCQTCHPTLPNLDVVTPLLNLAANDASIQVRRAAVRHLGLLPPDPRIANSLQEPLERETDGILRSKLHWAIEKHSQSSAPATCKIS